MKNIQLRFEICEDIATADFIFDAFGDTLNELFAACAAACFYAMTDLDKIEPVKEHDLELNGDTIEDLLYNFVSELIYLKDIEKIFLCVFKVDIAPDHKSLKAIVAGETIDYNKHTIKTDVKAATYHTLKIEKADSVFKAHMILDL